MSKEYIEREALVKGLDEYYHISHIQSLTSETEEAKILWKGIRSGVNYSRNHILEAPAADVAPVKHGEWIEYNHVDRDGHCYNTHYKCSVCGYDDGDEEYPFCPICGACMDGGK